VVGRFFKDSRQPRRRNHLLGQRDIARQAIGTGARTDGSAATPSLRTLGSGATQAAAGNHSHGIGAIVGAGAAASLNVGTTTGTVAAGDDARFGATSSNDAFLAALMGAL
jgi:hypothetical protein